MGAYRAPGPGDRAGVVELVDTPDLGSGGLGRGGSSPSARTKNAAIAGRGAPGLPAKTIKAVLDG